MTEFFHTDLNGEEYIRVLSEKHSELVDLYAAGDALAAVEAERDRVGIEMLKWSQDVIRLRNAGDALAAAVETSKAGWPDSHDMVWMAQSQWDRIRDAARAWRAAREGR